MNLMPKNLFPGTLIILLATLLESFPTLSQTPVVPHSTSYGAVKTIGL